MNNKKKFFGKIGVVFLMALILGVFSSGNVFAVTVGPILTSPEDGWKRIDDNDSMIKYMGNWKFISNYTLGYNSTEHVATAVNDKFSFKFNGSKLRVLGIARSNGATFEIKIDNIVLGTVNTSAGRNQYQDQTILFEKLNLSQGIHYVDVTVTQADASYFNFDAIDIDSTGALIDPNAVLATSIGLNKTSLDMAVGQTDTLIPTITPDNATNKSVKWTSSDSTIATVDNTGKVTSIKAGTATITATTTDSSNLSASCTVNVKNPDVLASGITLNKSTDSINIGSTDKLTATITPSNVTTMGVIWVSSDTSVATVDSNGNVKGVKAGTATITATTVDGTKLSATCTVTVNAINPTLDITSEKPKVNGGDEFVTYVALHNVTNIYAEDIRVNYDSKLFDFVKADVAKDGYEIFNQSVTTSGAIRFIVANKGENNGITGESQVLKLTFKAKNVSGKGKIEPSYGLVANGIDGTETQVTCVGTEVEVVGFNSDVNKDGRSSLADLAIDARHFSMDKSKWDSKYNVDVVTNDKVDEDDLKAVVQAMLKGEGKL